MVGRYDHKCVIAPFSIVVRHFDCTIKFEHIDHPAIGIHFVSLFIDGSTFDQEHETMTTVITLASRCAAPTQPTMGTPDTIQLHAEAHNALAMALHYLRQPSGNVPGAMRKAVQALAALRRLEGAA